MNQLNVPYMAITSDVVECKHKSICDMNIYKSKGELLMNCLEINRGMINLWELNLDDINCDNEP